MTHRLLIPLSLLAVAGAAGLVAAQRTLDVATPDSTTIAPPPSSVSPFGGSIYEPRRTGGTSNSRRGSGRLQSSWPPKPTDLSDRRGIAEWETDKNFKKDMFTFARLEWHSYRWADAWLTDFPDSELNFSFRLQQVTSLRVNPNPVRVKITDKELFDYPFVYMLEVATLTFYEEELEPLRRYLTNGGFLMVDDFWGERAWQSFKDEMKRVLPNVEPVELDLSHPIFHAVFDLKEKPQVPGIETAVNRLKGTGRTTEVDTSVSFPDGDGLPHYYGYFDEKGRMMAIVCHNTDLGDGWEREGEDPWYFKEFSVSKGYPMGVNIVFYALTH